jgi:hypothetical protein
MAKAAVPVRSKIYSRFTMVLISGENGSWLII